ncbi:MAG: divergent PAP2 family protein [Clostridium sp.]|nr:divergent PAP2 family protein [Clostridium sp.]
MYQIGTAVEVLGNALFAAVIAQILKMIYFLILHKKINFKIFTTTGGMPSSHSAGVMSLSFTIGYIEGMNSVMFALALGYAFVVMYDAAGIRRSAGKIAATMNRVMEEFYAHRPSAAGEKLKELLGHTPLEVFMGAIVGIIVSYVIHFLILQ